MIKSFKKCSVIMLNTVFFNTYFVNACQLLSDGILLLVLLNFIVGNNTLLLVLANFIVNVELYC